MELLKQYEYPEPFHIAAKNFFKKSKKYGSKDRRAIADLCYTYLRTGLSLQDFALETGLLLSSLLIEWESIESWNQQSKELGCEYEADSSDSEYLSTLFRTLVDKVVFYPEGILMAGNEHYNNASNLQFRSKNWAKEHTDKEERNLGIVGCKEIGINAKLQSTEQVQDLSSQFICKQISINDNDQIWDVCCGAGGKSLNLLSQEKGEFYLSDIRPTILENAKSRISAMHYSAHFSVCDLKRAAKTLKFGAKVVKQQSFDKIIADVPCSGSGTWFRTPEHFARFDYKTLKTYSDRQISIVENAIPFLKPGGEFYYVTCSVFSEENENVRDWIVQNAGLQLVEEISFDGIAKKADGMYMAKFTTK